jgi:DNA polymerase-3 subunit beta
MYLTVKKEQIIEGLQKAASIIPSKAGAAYLRSIWLQAIKGNEEAKLVIMSTDVNIEFTGGYPAEVIEEGTAGINGRAFVELLRRLPGGDINLRLDKESHILVVEQGRRSYKLPTVDPVWFQPLPPFPEDGAVLWSGDFFQDIIDRVAFCISDDDSTEGLSCLYIKASEAGHVDVCGLNGHQFAMVRFINDDLAHLMPENGLLIQKKYVNELRKWLGNDEIMLNISERRFHIRTGSGNETLSIPRSSNFTYPDHLSFLARLDGEHTSQLDVDRKECINALDRLLIFNNDSDRCTYFRFAEQDIELSAQGQETGSATEHLEGSYKGDLELIAFPTRSLMDILGHFQSSQLHYVFTGAEGPCGITGPDDAEYTVILMPMKIAESSYYTEE